MSLFGSQKTSYVGVDLGSGGIKLVELQNEKGRGRLVTYGFTDRAPDEQPLNLVDAEKPTADLLKSVAEKAKVTTKKAVTGLPISAVFSAVVAVPKGNDKEMTEAVQWQAKKLIPVPLEEMVLDFKVIGQAAAVPGKKSDDPATLAAAPGTTVPVLITGASKSMVQKYVAVFRQAGLDLVSLETEAFALIRSLVGKDKAPTMIVDMGSVRTNIVIVENAVPYVTRSLDLGGVNLTKAMSTALSVDMQRAEELKCEAKNAAIAFPEQGVPKIFEPTLIPMVTELKYSMNLYSGQGDDAPQKTIEKVILTGGAAMLPGLAQYFSAQLGVRVYAGDPWARVVIPDDLRTVLEEIGSRFAVPIGLAMRDIE